MIFERINAISIIREIYTDGHSPLLILGSDYKMYVAKNDKGRIPPLSLINESIAVFFLEQWEGQSQMLWDCFFSFVLFLLKKRTKKADLNDASTRIK